jgi:hypothetical protein
MIYIPKFVKETPAMAFFDHDREKVAAFNKLKA